MRSVACRLGNELLAENIISVSCRGLIVTRKTGSVTCHSFPSLSSPFTTTAITASARLEGRQGKEMEKEPFYGSPRLKSSASALSTIQSLSLTVYSATKAFVDPERHDMVATLSELTGHVALQNMYNSMMASKTGQRILTERPVVSKATIDIEKLEQMNKNSFGYAYAMFLKRNGFDPDMRADVKYVNDDELKYVMMRYRQSHDYYHVITDLPPTVPGELALKFAELFQTGLPVCALSATVGSFKLADEERKLWRDQYLPWAIKVGKDGEKWMNIYWEEEFDQDLEELRRKIGVVIAPKL